MNKPVIFAMGCMLLIIAACKSPAGNNKEKSPDLPTRDSIISQQEVGNVQANTNQNSITYDIIDAPEGTFGYNILMDGKVMINQTNIPGMPGIKGFGKKEDAVKVAELVIGKLKNNEMPPTVTTDELKKLGVGE